MGVFFTMSSINRNPRLHTFARELRKGMTDAEQRLWQVLRHKQLNGIKFRRQYVIGEYIVDFVSVAHKLVIELDGGQHASQQHYDEKRSAFLSAQGYRVLRFWNHEVLQQTEAIVAAIMLHCQTPPPRPVSWQMRQAHLPGGRPSPASGRGYSSEPV